MKLEFEGWALRQLARREIAPGRSVVPKDNIKPKHHPKNGRRGRAETGSIILLIYGLLLFAVGRASATDGVQYANEYWISTNATGVYITNNSGNITITPTGGTINNPLDGSTADTFDYNMDNLPAYCTVHILSGIYQTKGAGKQGNPQENYRGWGIKSGQRILGGGMNNTIIQLSRQELETGTEGAVPLNGTYVMGTSLESQDCEVSDLTLDANCQGLQKLVGGIEFNGTHNQARRIRLINNAAYSQNPQNPQNIGETQGFFFTAVGNYTSYSNCVIEDCEVSDFTGGSGAGCLFDAIALWGDGHNAIIKNNRVIDTSGYNDFVFSCPGNQPVIEGNYVEGVKNVFYTETVLDDLLVTHNHFHNCGIILNIQPHVPGPGMHNFVFENNDVILTNLVGGLGFEFLTYGTAVTTYTNIIIMGNRFQSVGVQPAGQSQYLIRANNLSGLVLANNVIDSGYQAVFDSSDTGINMYDNWDQDGNYLPAMNTPTIGGVGISSYWLGLISTPNRSSLLQTLGLPVLVTNQTWAGNFSGTLAGNATSANGFTGNLTGDVGGKQGATVVNTVGGQPAAGIAAAALAANTATSSNAPGRIVARDASGNFSAGSIKASLLGNATTATTAATATSLSGNASLLSPAANSWPGNIFILSDDLSCSLGANYFYNTAGTVVSGSSVNGNGGRTFNYAANSTGWPFQLATNFLNSVVHIDNACCLPGQLLSNIASRDGNYSPPTYDGNFPELAYFKPNSPLVTGIPSLVIIYSGVSDPFVGRTLPQMWQDLTNTTATLQGYGFKVAVCAVPLNGWCFSSGTTLNANGQVLAAFDSLITNNARLFDLAIDVHTWASTNGYEPFNSQLYIDGYHYTTKYNGYIASFIFNSISAAKLNFPSAQSVQFSSWKNIIPIQAQMDTLLSPVTGFTNGMWNNSSAFEVPANTACYFTPAPIHGCETTLSLNVMLPPYTTNTTATFGYFEYTPNGGSLHGMGAITLINSSSTCTNFVLSKTTMLNYTNTTSVLPFINPGSAGNIYIGPLILTQR